MGRKKKRGGKKPNAPKDAAPKQEQQQTLKQGDVTESDDFVNQQVSTAVAGRVNEVFPDPKEQQLTRKAPDLPGTSNTLDPDVVNQQVSTAVAGRVQEVFLDPKEEQLTRKVPDLPGTLAIRPPCGTKGVPVNLFVNYYPVELPTRDVYHYDVEISPRSRGSQTAASEETHRPHGNVRSLSKKRKREVISKMLEACADFGNIKCAFDGEKNLYTTKLLQQRKEPLTVFVELSDNSSSAGSSGDQRVIKNEFEVSIKPVCKKGKTDCAISLRPVSEFFEGKIDMVPQEVFMVVEAILRSGCSFKYVPVGRAFFYHPPETEKWRHLLGGGREIWFGYHQNFLLAERGPVVNINTTATTFHRSGPVIEYVSEILKLRVAGSSDYDVTTILNKKLKGLRVKTSHTGFQKRVIKVTRESADRLFFPMEIKEGKMQKRVSDYFLEKYKRLQYPNFRCLQVAPESKNVYLPMELCSIDPGQPANSKTLTEGQSKKMREKTIISPVERFRKNQEAVTNAGFNDDPCCRELGITVNSDPLRVEGRVIDSPTVLYHGDQYVKPENGRWGMNEKQFLSAAQVNSWLLLSIVNKNKCSRERLNDFVWKLSQVANSYGLNLRDPESITIHGEIDMKHAGVVLKETVQEKKNVNLVVIVLPRKNAEHHKEIKRVAENELGVVTQCVAFTTIEKCRPDVITKLCQKINAKMGGINNSLSTTEVPAIFNESVIIIGADVNHPDPNNGCNQPSIAAAVGSFDKELFRYTVTCRIQRHRDEKKSTLEIIKHLKEMVVELLQAFEGARKEKPKKIIFYRDGVSNGQFSQVLKEEVAAVKEACKSLEPEYNPELTFIVVQKRHNTRFFIENKGKPSNYNVRPGTVVDRTATSRINFDFFLNSHSGRQGTSRPGHYTVLLDENRFTSDDVQELTYYLCYIYARCTSSIGIPAPVKYADQAAYRAREYLNARDWESSSRHETAKGGSTKDLEATLQKAIDVHPRLKSAMYFV